MSSLSIRRELQPLNRCFTQRQRAGLVILLLMTVTVLCSSLPDRLLRGTSLRVKAATIFPVTTTSDSGAGSLRQAITDANGNPGLDMITFSIGSGIRTIVLTTDLPIVTDPVIIDGTTQPGFAGTPIIEVNGTNAHNGAGFSITAGNSTVRGLVLNRFGTSAIGLSANGGNHVEGNYLGTNVTGTSALPNGDAGLSISSPNNVIGGTTAGTRNVISGNGSRGIAIAGSSVGTTIQGNFIGVDATGTKSLGNGSEGIGFFGGSSVVVGGAATGAGNLISGNGQSGIRMSGTGNIIQGNLIGTNASGMAAIPNGESGVHIDNTTNNTVGGAIAGARNVISGNLGAGIKITESGATGNVIQGNFIGTAIDGFTPLPNSTAVANSSCGIFINRGSNNIIGGAANGEGNVIAFNGRCGVALFTLPNTSVGIGNTIRGNSIFSNEGLGIDNEGNGVTANDPIDADTGANRLQNFPVISSFTSSGGSTTIQGTLNSAPVTTFAIDFYANGACDPSGNGEGARFFGSTSITTDGAGFASFNVIIASALPPGQVITATATDPGGNTSEFSACDGSTATGSVRFSSASYQAIEDVGSLSVKLLRTGGSKGTLSANYATGGGTATAGQDYMQTSGTVTFADGETSKTFTIPILDDAVTEPDETVTLTLFSFTAPDAVGWPGAAVLTILDHSKFPILRPSDVSVKEGDSGTTDIVFIVGLSAASGKTVTVNYHTQAMSATSGVDYQPVTGALTFLPGVTEQPVTVSIIGDTVNEGDETFFLALTNAVNAGIAVGSNPPGQCLILDDDPLPKLSINDVNASEGNAGTTNFSFTVDLSAASGRQVSVSYATANGSAAAGTDYQAASGTVFFNPGEISKNIIVVINGDTTPEADETFFVNLTNPNNAALISPQGLGTILNDDGAFSTNSLQFRNSLYGAGEDALRFNVIVTRTGDNSTAATVEYATSDGSAVQRTDYTIASGTLNFAPGDTSKAFTIQIADDVYFEANETINLTLSNAVGATLGSPSSATLTIVDNDVVSATANPLDIAQFFVRQHYADFLNRSPDSGGLAFWTNEITQCGNDQACIRTKRIDVSNAFYYEREFQQTGSYVYRVYRESFGNNQPFPNPNPDPAHPGEEKKVPLYLPFIKDRARVRGGPQLPQFQLDFANAFVQRDEFKTKYPATLDGPGFVDAVLATIQNDIDADLTSQRDGLITLFNSGGRGAVIYRLADDNAANPINNRAFIDAEYNRAFVFTQYAGYLRRNPDIPGFLFWLGQVNSGPMRDVSKQHAMVCSFITSAEYQFRFSPVLTHTNAECPQ